MKAQERAALPPCELCAPGSPLPAQGEIRYKAAAQRDRRLREETNE